ncbi:MAG: hypothetical protein M1834_007214 [Cirrosporium novae-zelandiae]|nr:MAG: hypothetical protein M1834_007214 [Cirrosporium novae-zelandiae]
MSGMEKSKFRVIIVGGSIAGLTLAHCLDRAEIDHIVLERRDDISPQVGASIGIMPNGGRVLEQLGIFDEVEKEIEPLRQAHICYPDGFFFSSSYPVVLHERFGFPLAFLDRQKLLKILYTSLKDKSKVHVNKKVVEVQQLKSSLRVSTSDGSFYDCDLVVGADGVHSKVRSEMWRIADTQQPGLITMREKNSQLAPNHKF